MPSVTRSIYFCQVRYQDSDAPVSNSDLLAIWDELDRITRTNDPNCYLMLDGSERDRPWVDKKGSFPLRLRFGRTRRHGIPQIEGKGSFREIELNDEHDEGINDLFHMVAFGSSGVVGFELNTRAPRLTALSTYINSKTNSRIRFVNLLKKSAAQRLSQLGELTLMKLEVKSDLLEQLNLASSDLKNAIETVSEISECHELEITLKVPRGQDNKLSNTMLTAVKRIFSRGVDSGAIKKLRVRGRKVGSGQIDDVNLMKEFLVAKSSMLLCDEITRTLEISSAYSAIENAYGQLSEEIELAIDED